MPRFIHAADLHIDSPIKNLVPDVAREVRDASRLAFVNLVDRAIAWDVEFLILAGDLFDSNNPSVATSKWISEQLDRLVSPSKKTKIPVYLIRGNHDFLDAQASTVWPQHVYEFKTVAETRRLDSVGVALHGQSYPRQRETDNLAAKYPEAIPGFLNVGILHTALEGNPQHASYAPTTTKILNLKAYQYWALGHVHTHQLIGGTDGLPYIVFPGNLQGRHINEKGEKGAVLVEWEGTKIIKVEHFACDVLRWREELVQLAHEVSDLRALAAQVAQQLAQRFSATDLSGSLKHAIRLKVSDVPAHLLRSLEIENATQVFRHTLTRELGSNVLMESMRLHPKSTLDLLPEEARMLLNKACQELQKQGIYATSELQGFCNFLTKQNLNDALLDALRLHDSQNSHLQTDDPLSPDKILHTALNLGMNKLSLFLTQGRI